MWPRIDGLVVLASLAALSSSCERAPRAAPLPPPAVVEQPAPVELTDPLADARARARAVLATGDLDGALAALAAVPDGVVAAASTEAQAAWRCDRGALLSRRASAAPTLRQREKDLRAAVEACPGEPRLRDALADALLGRAREQTDDGPRLGFLKESIALAPGAPALVDLALLLERDNDPAGALEAIISAEARAPGEPQIAMLKERLQKTATVEQTFKSARHAHFVARFEGYGEERLAWGALDTLEQAYFRVGRALDLHPTERITVVIYTGDQYRQATGGPDWSTGLFDGKIRIREGQLAADKGSLDDTLVHEYVHAALHTLPVKVPPWFHEGLAQHFEVRRAPPRLVMQRAGVAPRDALEVPFTQLPADVVPAAYATAQAVIERMVERRGQWGLNQLIAELRGGRDFNDAIQRAFAVDVDTLYREAVDPGR